MWSYELLGTDVYHLLAAFVIYSILGWFVESVYMSFCNRKLTNRGFGKGPFCPIYGFGAVIGYLVLCPLKGKNVALYIVGALLATAFEFVVGKGMIKFLGELWWDYNEKPFNYKGIICLESTIAWGFYAIGIVNFLHGAVNRAIDRVDMRLGIAVIVVAFLALMIDYAIQLAKVFEIDIREKREQLFDYFNSRIVR